MVLKDNAYGHGLLEIANLAHEYGISKAIVRRNGEAHAIEHLFSYILVLDDIAKKESDIIRYSVNSLEQIASFAKGSLVELKVDTGMHRNGVAINEVEEALSLIEKASLTCKGIFTHFRSADTLSSELFWQKKQFEVIIDKYAHRGFQFHSANSAGVFRSGTCAVRNEEVPLGCKEDMVRVGIAAYGCLELDRVYDKPDLIPVLSLIAKRQTTRILKASQHVGYNATCKVDKDTEVSTYDVGYADGLLRSASNRYITPNGSKILGRISMDNVTLMCEDDEVTIFNNANEFAKVAQTIGYEVLTGLSPYLERKLI